jgi:hypothetical protein
MVLFSLLMEVFPPPLTSSRQDPFCRFCLEVFRDPRAGNLPIGLLGIEEQNAQFI